MANHAGTFQSRFFPAQPETEGDDPIFNTLLDAFSMYETAKANAGITLSSTIFDDLNPTLSTEWEKVKASLKI